MGTISFYNWINVLVYMGLDNIVHHDRDHFHYSISNACIEDWESDILRTQDQENEQRLLQKYNNIRFLDDGDNKTYIIDPESLEFKGNTRSNKQYCVVGHTLNCKDGDNVDLLFSKDINDDFMVLIKVVEQDPDMGVKTFHQSIDDNSEATDGEKQVNSDYNIPETPYDGKNMNASSDDGGNNDEDAPETPYDG